MSSRFLAAVNDAGEMFSASTAPDIASQLTALSRRQRKPTSGPSSGRSPHWLKIKNSKAPAVPREAEADWGR